MSDQDFFFDEDETAPPAKAAAEKPAAKVAGPKSSPAVQTPAPAASETGMAFLDQSVTMTVASLLMAIALLIGVIIGFLMAGVVTPAPVSTATTTEGAATGTGTGAGTAPQLSSDQLQQELPAGHVPVSGASSDTAGTAPAP